MMKLACDATRGHRVRAAAAALAVAALACAGPLGAAAAAPVGQSAGLSKDGGATVPAPGAGDSATVTVSKATNLVNQTVRVSWTGFEPSSASRLENSGDSLDVNTLNPVRVYECRGTDPASSSDCYGSPGFRGIDATNTQPAVPAVPPFTYPGQTDPFNATPDGPANWQDNVTSADGTGEVTIQVFTKRESAALGCDTSSPCSIVVVPNYGRPLGATEDLMDAPWAWERRTVVPLAFLPVEDACPLTGDSLRVEGSPIAAHVIASWRARTCTLDSNSVRLDYTSIGEPQTRGDVASGTTDVGLVLDPMDADAAAERGVVYAPLSVTGLAVAFQVDDAEGQPVTHMNLNARLVAKLVTGSYRSGADPAIIDNPVNLFHDPEFLKLNPGVDWPGGAPGNHPLILGDLSDTTLALTRWIESDPAARAFIAGKPDPWGMTVNSNYKNVPLPFASFPLLDPLLSETFAPIQELDALSRQLSIAQFPGGIVEEEGGVNITVKPPRQNPGRREVIGIIDAAAAHQFLLHTAALQNAAGTFVEPTNAGLLAGIKNSDVNPDGVTRTVDQTSKDPAVYPLTVLVSAALSTKADKPERTEMANMLSFVAAGGQKPGDEVGQLPDGHAPLPEALVKQVLAARKAVLAGYTAPGGGGHHHPGDGDGHHGDGHHGDGHHGDGTGDGTGTGTSNPPPSTPPGDGDDPPPGDGDPTTDPNADGDLGPTMLSVSSQPAGGSYVVLPLLGAAALATLVVGPTLMWLSRSDRGPSWLHR